MSSARPKGKVISMISFLLTLRRARPRAPTSSNRSRVRSLKQGTTTRVEEVGQRLEALEQSTQTGQTARLAPLQASGPTQQPRAASHHRRGAISGPKVAVLRALVTRGSHCRHARPILAAAKGANADRDLLRNAAVRLGMIGETWARV